MTDNLRIQNLAFSGDDVTVTFDSGGSYQIPLRFFPRLRDAEDGEREKWKLIGRGLGVHWEALDEDISVENFLVAYSRHRGPEYARLTK